jgi:hypothetical protein
MCSKYFPGGTVAVIRFTWSVIYTLINVETSWTENKPEYSIQFCKENWNTKLNEFWN